MISISRIKTFFKTPKGYVLAALLFLTAIAGFDHGSRNGWINVATAVGTAVLLDIAFAVQQERKRIVPDSAALTGLIVALVLSSSVPWYICAVTSAVAIVSKHLFKIKKKPVFNPAAFGLAFAVLLFKSGQSWWGGLSNLPAWCVVFVLAAGLLVARRVNKLPLVFAFLGSYFSLLLLFALMQLTAAGDAFRLPFSNSALFLAFFMMTDPPTSPAKYKEQITFGIFAALISVADFMLLNGLSFLLLGLLAANGWNAWGAYSLKKPVLRRA
jgi:Na+-translocating ferredoxin:NAD+ oxidoreductase RnfD subunit